LNRWLCLVGIALCVAPAVRAQRNTPLALAPPVASEVTAVNDTLVAGGAVARPRSNPPWWTPLASAAIPGAGQARLGQDRFVAYLAIEAYALLQYATDTREARRQRGEYRELARRVARGFFSEQRPDGDFAYYETMSKYLESGVYDLVPGGELQPELETGTYNGDQWLLARQTFWASPDAPPDPASQEYAAALNFYRARAIGPEYRWSWRNAQLEQDLYRRTIGLSNDAVRRSIADLGVILANHALSMVDAYVSVRLQRPRAGFSHLGIEASIPWPTMADPPRAPGQRP